MGPAQVLWQLHLYGGTHAENAQTKYYQGHMRAQKLTIVIL